MNIDYDILLYAMLELLKYAAYAALYVAVFAIVFTTTVQLIKKFSGLDLLEDEGNKDTYHE